MIGNSFNNDFRKTNSKFRRNIFLVIGGVTLFIFIVYGVITFFAVKEINDNGGVRKTIVKYGKEIKSITDEINEN